MGIVIFLTAVIVETAFAVFCIMTKSNHARKRSLIRIVSFIAFMLLAVLPIIDWSFRYYALASLLLLLAIIGGKALIQEKREKREYKTARVVVRAIGMTILLFALSLPAIIFPQNKAEVGTTGEYQALTQTFTYTDKNRVESYTGTDKNRVESYTGTDKNRGESYTGTDKNRGASYTGTDKNRGASYTSTGKNRKLNVQLWYPDNLDEKVPLIVFSHGGLGVKSSNESLYNELVSHGYIVCSIDHTYQSFYSTAEDGDTTWIDLGYMQELFAEAPQSNIQQSYEYYQKWMKIRMDDINFIIDHIVSESRSVSTDSVYKLVDIAKIGVMGHSLGGSAALGIGRIRADVTAVIALESPFMYDIEGIEGQEFIFTDEIYPVPVLNVYSDSAWSILGQRPQYAANYKMLFDTDATAFNVYISGVGHLALTDFALTSPFLTRILDGKRPTTETISCLRTINKICLEFFNSYLKGDGEFTSSGSY